MTYPEAIQYLESFINYEKIPTYPYKESLKLERIMGFLETIGHPQEYLLCIHIAGTKGKGSTCAFIASLLKQAGFKVGLYTSPHLSDFRERIRILSSGFLPCRQAGMVHSWEPKADFEGMISKKGLTDIIERHKPFIEKYNQDSKFGPLTFFEVYTALAFTYFKEQNVDFSVLETGMGGRLDATNAVGALSCVITPISYDHTAQLGTTLKEIATEKAGIIKRAQSSKFKAQSLNVISAPQENEVMQVIRDRCEEIGARLVEVNKDIFYEATHRGFNVMGLFQEYPHLELRLMGRHQIINAACAIGAMESLRYHNIFLDADEIRQGLYNTVWPGRCEVVFQNPFIVLDGAQNAASAAALKETIKENFQYKRLILVLGISEDKDREGVCREFYDWADEVILTQSSNPRALAPRALARYFENKVMHVTKNVKEAKRISRSIAQRDDLILVTGSLFVVGEFRNVCE